LTTNIIHVCKGQVTYFLGTAIMSKDPAQGTAR
jgi:hypothetical protein